MNKQTKLKVTLITIVSVIVGMLYINRGQIISGFKSYQRDRKWGKEDSKGQLINGGENGEWKAYFKNGQLASIENYKNDTLHGIRIFYTPAGQRMSRTTYNMGVQVGFFFFYFSNGRVNYEGFKNQQGKDEGVFKIYHDNGQLSQIGQHVNGDMDGEFRTFDKSGKLKEIEHYKLNKKTGTWIYISETSDTTKIDYD